MSKAALFAIALVAVVAACAKKTETVYTEPTAVSQEPVYTGKL